MYFVGVDVGTGSVRAALVDGAGRILKKSTNATQTWNPETDFYQQSSEDIWRCCCKVVRVRYEKLAENIRRVIAIDLVMFICLINNQT